tara:strand:+ start:1288 stop:1866 length:579 start_codon:yes stop_codon:yes gene_type:complete
MKETFLFFLELGYNHVLDYNGLDHFYFLAVMTLPYKLDKWIQLIKWVTIFTVGHCLSLFANQFFNLKIDSYLIELLIPLTISYSCISILLKSYGFWKQDFFKHIELITFFFGIIHGLGFGRYFNQIAQQDSSLISLLGFAFGVEFAQIIIVLFVVILNMLVTLIFNDKYKLWMTSASFLFLILSLKMVFERL